jgi:hypothetical protein
MAVKKGFIKYASAGFEQDSGQAMKNDVLRALIELITNCDDAYARAKKSGRIEVVVRRSTKKGDPIVLTVRDRATGLDPQGMEDNFVVLGGNNSGFAEGEDVRGLFSRGSKDTAWFGKTVFESIKEGVYSRLELNQTGDWEAENRDATNEDYSSLGLSKGECGLSATMVITRQDTRVPELRDLVSRLSSHVQLRRIIETQDVVVTEFRDGKLVQSPKVVREVPASTVLFDGEIEIVGYDCTAHLVINRLNERSEGPVTEYSEHGIEVRGRRAAYMNSMFAQSGPATALVNGVLTCPTIDDLIRSFGQQGASDTKNPMRLVSRSRDGLEPTHPFMTSLNLAVLEKLKPILAELEPAPAESGSAELRKDLDTFAKLLAEEMKSDLDDEDDDGVGGNLPTASKPIIVIPPVAKIRLGGKGTLTVLVHESSEAVNGLTVVVSSPVCRMVGKPTELKQHVTFPETVVGQIRLEGLSLGSSTIIVSASSKPSDAGSAEVIVHDSDDDETEPTTLEWKNPSMSVTVGKTRSVRLRAPVSLAPTGELEVNVALEGSNIRLDDHSVVLKLTTKGWLEALVRVTGVTHSLESCTIIASGAGEIAHGAVRTTLPNPTNGLNIETELVDRFAGPLRGEILIGDTGLKLVMYGRHRALASRLGSLRNDGSYTRDTELDTLVVIAEVMASVASDHVLMMKVKRDPALLQDIDKVMYERTKLVDRYLRILIEGLRATANEK